jgi:hypothetical protein
MSDTCAYYDDGDCSRNYPSKVRELKAELAKVNEAGEVLHAKYREVEADISRLRACLKRYGEHFRSCPAHSNMPKEPCTCGFAAELKEGE